MPTRLIRIESDHPHVVRIALVYVAIALTWVLLGDVLLARFLQVERRVWFSHTIKGTVLVLLTAAVLFWLVALREKALSRERRRLQLVFGQLPGVLWSTGVDLRIESVIGELVASVPGSASQVGRPIWELADTPEARELIELNHRRALDGEASDFHVQLGGRELAVRVEPLRDEPGVVVGTVGFALETTWMADEGSLSVRDALRHTRDLGALGGLTLDVAHQLKNPLFALTASLDAFEQRVVHQPATARHREIMRQQVERIERLVSGIQVYGRRLHLSRRRFDLVPLLVSSISRARAESEAAEVEVELRLEASEIFAEVDHEAIVGAFDRILRNAVEHSPRGGRVAVEVRTDHNGGPPGVAEVSVLDEGPGFAAGDLAHVFKPLFGRRPGGAGLGLAIAERIVAAHDGHIAAANRESGGARVTVRLPAGSGV